MGQNRVYIECLNSTDAITLESISVIIGGESKAKKVEHSRLSFLIGTEDATVFLSHPGFEDYKLKGTFQPDTLLKVLFLSKSRVLNEVLVSGRLNENIKSLDIGVETLSIKKLSKIPVLMGEVDIQRGLQTLPGLSSVGEVANGLNIRGVIQIKISCCLKERLFITPLTFLDYFLLFQVKLLELLIFIKVLFLYIMEAEFLQS